MKKSATISLMCALALPASAFAQETATPPVEEPAVEPMPVEEPEPVAEEVAEEEEEEEAEDDDSILSHITGNVFMDGFFHVDWNRPDPGRLATATPPAAGAAVAPGNNPFHRGYEFAQGFGLAFAGADFQYENDDVAVRLDLRFGEGMNRYLGQISGGPVNAPLSVVKQAFLRWKAAEGLSFDLGQFDTLYGAEVADSWKNVNYTRGALYFLMQPFYHTGLRMSYALSDTMGLNAMIVNGTNNPIANTVAPHAGAQLTVAPSDSVFLAFGYYTGPGASGFGAFGPVGTRGSDQNDDWEHFIDVVATVTAGDLSLVGNVDFYIGPKGSLTPGDIPMYYGISLAAKYQIMDEFAIGLRGEFLHDIDSYLGNTTAGAAEVMEQLATATLTLDYRPVPQLIIRLDNRFEWCDGDIFQDDNGGFQGTWFASTLGLVVTMN